ncbi:uncharacterized protein LOC129005253 [Macrosteles quadrilineatus]|uniref:uncharacterized protein LOC129005253 n=1 Tax=Macrosteles quadrilineatus TaxID=74068 RepID=UPI0023E092D2|nr:uncharacterized protein LOC129005253 [Macrosteles quadrilineatus]
MSKLSETSLPPIEAFHNSLTDEELSSEEYEHACKVWSHFNIANLEEYTMLYLRTDVIILGDVFQNFRKIVHSTYGLDPAYYFTAPGLAFDAMLKITDVRLELLTCREMHDFCRRGMRGGFVTTPLKYCKANNYYMGELYNKEEASSYIYNIDMNSLYATAMCQPLPYGGFEWADIDELEGILEAGEDSEFGAFLEVTMEYPEHLHEVHGDYPFLPTQEENEDGNMCLMATVHDKTNYVLHHTSLQLAMKHGLVLKHVHRILKFKQSKWCEKFILLNTEMRKQSKNKFEEDFYKGFSNSAFGRSIMKLDDRVNIKIAKTNQQVDKFSRSRLFKEFYAVSEDTLVFVMHKPKIIFNTPIYMGVAILDISKTIMYSFYYDYLKPMYGNKIRMGYSDTDSILAHIYTQDLYQDLKNSPIFTRLDTSNYPKNHILYQTGRRFGLGLAKDEAAGDLPVEYVGLCSKVYSKKKLILETGQIVVYGMKAKGTQKSMLRKHVTFDDYFQSLMSRGNFEMKLPFTRISSSRMQITTVTGFKTALRCHDPKRFLCSDGIHTLPFGDKRIEEEKKKIEEEESEARRENE